MFPAPPLELVLILLLLQLGIAPLPFLEVSVYRIPNYDLVLIDAPSVLGLVDAMLTASSCRSVIIMASIGKVTRTQVNQATAMLSKLNLIGVVANGVSSSDSTYVPYVKPKQFVLQPAMEE